MYISLQNSLLILQLPASSQRGFGFIEYDSQQAALDAVSSMNLFDLGGQFLRVGKAVTPPDADTTPTVPSSMPTAAAVAAAAVTAKITAMDAVCMTGSEKSENQEKSQPASAIPPQNVSVGESMSLSAAPVGVSPMQTRLGQQPPAIAAVPPPGVAQVGIIPPPSVVTSLPAPGLVPPGLILPASIPMPPTQGDAAASGPHQLTEAQKKVMEEDPAQSLDQQENLKISGSNARHLVMQKLMRQSESRVMVLRNMVGQEDLDDELESEVTEECGKFGAVERVIIYQEKQSEEEDAEVIFKIFVEFSSLSEMETACKALNGRYFGGRIVTAQKYDQDMYEAGDLSG